MKQTLTSLKLVGFVQNEGEKRSRKVVMQLTLDGKSMKLMRSKVNKVLESSLPELHPGQGRTKYVAG